MRQAREHVAAEIAPFLRELIMRAEEVLARDEREARALRSKVCILSLTLGDSRAFQKRIKVTIAYRGVR